MTGSRRVGVDVGGTKCLGVVIDQHGTVTSWARRPTATRFDELAATVAAIIAELDEPGDDIDTGGGTGAGTIGIGLPGLVDRQGRLHAAPHLDDAIDLAPIEAATLLAEHLGRKVVLDNDATCATLAEWRLGAARGLDNMVLVTLGTGIGGGVVSDGRVLRGEHGFAGEFGHFQVDPLGPACSCGKRGCWETFASGRALSALAAAGLGMSGEQVEQAARDGDPAAQAVLDEFARQVAIGLSALTNMFDPAAFVLGGGLAQTRDVLAEPLARWTAEYLYSASRRPVPGLLFAELGPQAGAIGAALLSSSG